MYSGTVSAKKLGFSYGGGNTVLTGVFEIEFEEVTDELDATTGEDDGYGDTDTGIVQATVRAKGQVDIVNSPYVSIRPRTTLTNVKLWHALDDAEPFAVIPLLKVTRAPKRGTVRGKWEFDLEGKSRGSYTVNS